MKPDHDKGIDVNVTIKFDDAALKALSDKIDTGFSGLGFSLSAIQRQFTKEIRMAKQEMLDAVAAAKTAVAEMKESVATDLAEIIRRLQAGDPTAEVVAAINDVIVDVKGVDILPDFPAPPPPSE